MIKFKGEKFFVLLLAIYLVAMPHWQNSLYKSVAGAVVATLCLLYYFTRKMGYAKYKKQSHRNDGISGEMEVQIKSLTNCSEESWNVENVAKEISALNEDLRETTGNQQDAVDNTSSYLTEISIAVTQTSKNIEEVLSLSQEGIAQSSKGKENIEKLKLAMNEIGSSMSGIREMVDIIKSIEDKTKMIHDIVFQTKLLSFNASVEAARAGEYGRGFSVVAEEIGKLAISSGETAKEIGKLIKISTTKVEEIVVHLDSRISAGGQLTDHCTTSFLSLHKNMNQIAPQIANITQAANKQDQGVKKTATSLKQLNFIVDQNSTLLNQMGDLSNQLNRSSKLINSEFNHLGEQLQVHEFQQHLHTKNQYLNMIDTIGKKTKRAHDINDVYQATLNCICQNTIWPIGHVYTMDLDRLELVTTGIWYLDNSNSIQEFKKVTERATFAPGIGLPGRVYRTQKPAWILDVHKDPNFPRAAMAKNIGVRTAFGFPVVIAGKVLSVIELFSKQTIQPDQLLLKTLNEIGQLIGRYLQRKESVAEISRIAQEIRINDKLSA